jgi:hypothetical protein
MFQAFCTSAKTAMSSLSFSFEQENGNDRSPAHLPHRVIYEDTTKATLASSTPIERREALKRSAPSVGN